MFEYLNHVFLDYLEQTLVLTVTTIASLNISKLSCVFLQCTCFFFCDIVEIIPVLCGKSRILELVCTVSDKEKSLNCICKSWLV